MGGNCVRPGWRGRLRGGHPADLVAGEQEVVNTKVMGIDLGIAKVACAHWEDDELTEAYSGNVDYLTHREDQLYSLSDYVACQVAGWQPDYIFIEDVLIGNNRKYSLRLAETKGAVLAGIGRVHERYRPQVIPVNVSTWKKEILGNGHASKEDIRNWLTDYNSAYAELCDGDQDQFDAACIGYYGLILSRRADQLVDGSAR